MTKTKTIFLLLFLVPFVGWSHGDKTPLIIKGAVLDAQMRDGIVDVIVTVEKNGQVIESTKTKADGTFELKFTNTDGRLDKLQVTIQKKGFKSQRMAPLPGNNQNVQILLNKRLHPIPLLNSKMGSPTLCI